MSERSPFRQVIQSGKESILYFIGDGWGRLAMQVTHKLRNFFQCGSRKSVTSHSL